MARCEHPVPFLHATQGRSFTDDRKHSTPETQHRPPARFYPKNLIYLATTTPKQQPNRRHIVAKTRPATYNSDPLAGIALVPVEREITGRKSFDELAHTHRCTGDLSGARLRTHIYGIWVVQRVSADLYA